MGIIDAISLVIWYCVLLPVLLVAGSLLLVGTLGLVVPFLYYSILAIRDTWRSYFPDQWNGG